MVEATSLENMVSTLVGQGVQLAVLAGGLHTVAHVYFVRLDPRLIADQVWRRPVPVGYPGLNWPAGFLTRVASAAVGPG